MHPAYQLLLILKIPLLPTFIHLYIDPGTGSIILQAVVAGIAGATLLIRFGWRRILEFFGIKKKDKEKPE